MSWFTDLTSKAEAMLVRLDQDAARTLQNPENIRRGTRLLDKAISVLDPGPQETEPILYDSAAHEENSPSSRDRTDDQASEERPTSTDQRLVDISVSSQDAARASSSSVTDDVKVQQPSGKIANNRTNLRDAHSQEKVTGHAIQDDNHNISQVRFSEVTTRSKAELVQQQQARKFKLQTSKLRKPIFDRHAATTSESSPKSANGHGNRPANMDGTLIPASPGADDIRESINRSLHEYSLTASSASYSHFDPTEQTTYSSHFDNQPNLIQSPNIVNENNRLNDRLQSSPSFSISFPDSGERAGASSTDIANQILRQGALKKKSAFNLHKVLNKLASSKGHPQAIIGDKTKLRLRRAQMRVTSQLRRLNYYFRAYPTMKYWMLGYLVALQMLVIYVLFFYQSSSSSSYLATQVKQQQQELDESLAQSNSEKSIPSSGDFSANGGFR